MKKNHSIIVSGAIWTVITYAISMSIRLGSNIVLTRLLAPQMIGIVVVVNTIRLGLELFSDLGIEQNVVNNKDGETQDFLNTAWTLQIIRGLFLSVIFFSLSPFLAKIYEVSPDLFFIVALSPVIGSLSSTSIFVLVKNLQIRKRYTFEITCELISLTLTIALAWIWRDAWAVVIGTVLAIGVRSLLSHFLPHPPHKLTINRAYFFQIVGLGKWIMLSSFVMYASTQIDKIYLGGAIPLAVFGIYGVARAISDLPSQLAGRLCYQILFPIISASKEGGVHVLKTMLAPQRWKLLLVACFFMSIGISFSDIAVDIVYDARYHQAGWMLCILLIGAWFGVLSGLNEGILLSEHPLYHSVSNCIRFAFLIVGLYAAAQTHGVVGVVIVVATGEIIRYAILAYGQFRVSFSFAKQDSSSTLMLMILVIFWMILRYYLDLGSPLQALI